MNTESGLTLESLGVLFVSMALLAAVPSASVMLVAARSAAYGLAQGFLTTAGIVAGDLVFIVIALFGLSSFYALLEGGQVLVGILGSLYITGIGVALWRAAAAPVSAGETRGRGTAWRSLAAGFLLTLADQKAVLFYLGFLPAFVDVEALSWGDGLWIAGTAAAALLGTKLVYAGLAAYGGAVAGGRFSIMLNKVAGGVLIGVGVLLGVSTLRGVGW